MALPSSPGVSRRRRQTSMLAPALAAAIAVGGCSFDLGSMTASENDKPKIVQKPGADINAQSIGEAQGYATRAQILARSGKTEEALSEFDHALELDPYNAPALYGRGLLYQGDKQHQRAIEDFTAANGLTPQKPEPLLGRATSYLALDKTKEAAADLDEAVQFDPNSAPAWASRGVAYERLGDKAKAAASYSRAVALRPKDEASRSGLTRVGG